MGTGQQFINYCPPLNWLVILPFSQQMFHDISSWREVESIGQFTLYPKPLYCGPICIGMCGILRPLTAQYTLSLVSTARRRGGGWWPAMQHPQNAIRPGGFRNSLCKLKEVPQVLTVIQAVTVALSVDQFRWVLPWLLVTEHFYVAAAVVWWWWWMAQQICEGQWKVGLCCWCYFDGDGSQKTRCRDDAVYRLVLVARWKEMQMRWAQWMAMEMNINWFGQEGYTFLWIHSSSFGQPRFGLTDIICRVGHCLLGPSNPTGVDAVRGMLTLFGIPIAIGKFIALLVETGANVIYDHCPPSTWGWRWSSSTYIIIHIIISNERTVKNHKYCRGRGFAELITNRGNSYPKYIFTFYFWMDFTFIIIIHLLTPGQHKVIVEFITYRGYGSMSGTPGHSLIHFISVA